MEVTARFQVSPVYMAEGSTKLGRWTLRRFQEEVLDSISGRRDVVLSAPTGAGKTLSLFLGESGMVGLYPNNTLLLDQQRSVDRILRIALEARLAKSIRADSGSSGVDLLRVYELGEGSRLPVSPARRLAVVLLSGRYIPRERDESGRLVPKREYIMERLVRPICYPERLGDLPYVIVLGTPDTAFMILSGIYRDFERVGYALHDAIVGSVEGANLDQLLSDYGVATSKELKSIATIRDCLLHYPWFIDEYHLYGLYEASLVLPLVHVYRDYVGWDNPIVFSSATPKGPLFERIMKELNPRLIRAEISTSGSREALVRGETTVEIISVEVPGRGLSKWFQLGYRVGEIVSGRLYEIREVAGAGGNIFIVVDRVNQVPPIVALLNKHGMHPECSVAIRPDGCADSSNIVVGSESISQGIDRENVRYGIVTSYNWASLIQRFGRIGRKTTSKIILVLPAGRKQYPLEELDGRIVNYNDFVDKVKETYPSVDPASMPLARAIEDVYTVRARLVEYASAIHYAKVSSAGNMMEAIQDRLRGLAPLLNRFYGRPEVLPSILTFRSTGPPMIARGPGGDDYTDMGTIIRNFSIRRITTTLRRREGAIEKWLVADIDLEPKRYYAALKPKPSTPEDLLAGLSGMITTMGTLLELGYELQVISWEDPSDRMVVDEVPPNVLDQPLAVLRLSSEIVKYYAYTGRGVYVLPENSGILGLFL